MISVIMPTYNPNVAWLIEAIDSVKNQTYPHWELCIADDASTEPEVRELLRKYSNIDPRIKIIFCAENGHICTASNSALGLASGSWVALMDQDDLLSEYALCWMAQTISANPSIQMIYSDEDKVDEFGNRHSPYFKCDWYRDLFYSQNMISHLGVYNRELIESIGGFKEGMEGSQDSQNIVESLPLTKVCC